MFLDKIKILLKGPMAVFVYGILSKWYIMVAISAIVVVFWVLKGLTEAGVLQNAEKVVSAALKDTKSVARYCVPKITNLSDFWSCLQNPPEYVPDREEQEMVSKMQESAQLDKYNKNKDPYAE